MMGGGWSILDMGGDRYSWGGEMDLEGLDGGGVQSRHFQER